MFVSHSRCIDVNDFSFRMLVVDKSHCKLGASGGNSLNMNHDSKKQCVKLSLRRNYIENAEDILQDFSSLTWLCLSANALNSIPRAMIQLSHLKHLYISNNKIKLIENLEKCPDLETLDLRHNQLQEISGVAHLTTLKSLSVSGNSIKDISPESIPTEQLVFLGFYGNQISDFQTIVSVVRSTKKLNKLFIGANPFCNNLPLKSTFNVSVCLTHLKNGAKRVKCDEAPLNLSKVIELLRSECPSLTNLDNNLICNH